MDSAVEATGDAPPPYDDAEPSPGGPSPAAGPTAKGWLREAAIVLGFYYVYQTIRSLADTGRSRSQAYSNASWIVRAERRIYLFHEQAIQHLFLGARWLIRLMNIYYGTLHFAITVGLLVWLFMKRHEAYRAMRNLLGITTALAIIGYWSFPLAPPRLYLECDGNIPVLGQQGGLVRPDCFVDTLKRIGGLWSYHSPVAKAVANQYAAMPSLHFGWALWCGIVFWRFAAHRSTRALAVMYPLLTLFAVVVTANHYFLDAAGGAALVLIALTIVRYVHLRQPSRRSPTDAVSADPTLSADPAATV